ncbi:MAG: IS630 family transposase [Hyphomicrobiaceae bacterium]
MAWKSGQSYSTDLRSRVLAAVDGGSPAKAVAQLFQVSVSYIYKALGRRSATGETEARAQRNQQTLKLAAHHDAIAAEVARRPDVTLEELRAWLLATHEVKASLGLMHKTLARLGLTPQKKSGRAEEQDRADIAELRTAWRAGQGAMSPASLIFVDETGVATNMARRYGRSPRGLRLDGPIPHGHWKSTTFVGGLTARGFVAPYVLDGAMNGDIFKAWVEQMLAPELRPGDIVIMDNLAAHKVDGIRKAIEARGAELRYLPPYSPDLNPIEQAFAKLKALLRKAAERTVDGLWNAIGKLLDLFPASECANYLVNSGYPRSA